MKYFKEGNGIVIQVIASPRAGFTATSEHVVCGMTHDSGVFSIPVKTSIEIAEKTAADDKIQRFKKIAAITAEVDNMVFDANEISQSRISIRISSMPANTDKARWKLADNTWTDVTKAQFLSVLSLAATESTKIMGG